MMIRTISIARVLVHPLTVLVVGCAAAGCGPGSLGELPSGSGADGSGGSSGAGDPGDGSGSETASAGVTGDPETTDDSDVTGDPEAGGSSDAGLDSTTSGVAECGNGLTEDGETCDDGNAIDADGCNVDCVESGAILEQIGVPWDEIWPIYAIAIDDTGGELGLCWGLSTVVLDLAAQILWSSPVVCADAVFDHEGGLVTAGNGDNGVVRRFDPYGTPAWSQSGGGPFPAGYGVQIAANGEIVVAGQYGAVDADAFVRRLTLGGGVVVEYSYPDAGFRDLALDSADNLVLGGALMPQDTGTTHQWVAHKDPQWATHWETVGSTESMTNAVAVSADDEIAAVGTNYDGVQLDAWVTLLDADGNELYWEVADHPYHDELREVAVDSAGHIVAVGWREDDAGVDEAVVRKFEFDGTPRWEQTIAGGRALAVAIAPDDSIYVGVWYEDGSSTVLYRLAP